MQSRDAVNTRCLRLLPVQYGIWVSMCNQRKTNPILKEKNSTFYQEAAVLIEQRLDSVK